MWNLQMTNFFLKYDLMGFVDGNYPCLPIDDLEYKNQIHQDQLLLLAIQMVVIRLVGSLVSQCKSAQEAWNKLKTTYANKSNTWMVGLIDSLTKVS